MLHRWWVTLVYATLLLAVGLWAGVEAGEFKPNAFGFCATLSIVLCGSGFLDRLGKPTAARLIGLLATSLALGFYLFCFVGRAETTPRIAVAIVASFAELLVLLAPRDRRAL